MISLQRISLTVFLICFFIFNTLKAQIGYEDAVYLKNGSIVRGIIIEQIPNQSIKIQTRDRNIFVYKMEEIEKITKENTGYKKSEADAAEIKKHPYSGFSIGVEMGVGSGTGTDNMEEGIASAHALIGYMHQSIFTAGILAGFNMWGVAQNQEPLSLLDCSFAFRLFPLRSRFTPFLSADAGYAVESANTGVSGGITYNLGVGGRINFTQKRGLNLCLAYKAQRLHQTEIKYNYINPLLIDRSFWVDGVCLTAGFSF